MSHITVRLRSRAPNPTERTEEWPAQKTAIIVCDMWDRHWCAGASRRVDEMAPVMNGVLSAARKRGILIVHAPSDTMDHYCDYPQRKRATQAVQVLLKTLKQRPAEPELPIDDSDQGCEEGGEVYWAWSCQHPAIEISEEDLISDDGQEIYNVLAAQGIENVAIMGVHTNMCVLGRSFGLRRMVERGMNTVLVRDLTDSMYNPARYPYVSHEEGTALVVEHIETHVCPSIESTDLTG